MSSTSVKYISPEISFNIFDSENISSLFKFYGINILLSVILSLIILLILNLFGNGKLGAIVLFIVVLIGQLYAIRLFEKWDGCYFKQIISN